MAEDDDILRFAKWLTIASAIGIVAPIVYFFYVAATATDHGPAGGPEGGLGNDAFWAGFFALLIAIPSLLGLIVGLILMLPVKKD
jgi:hypothetical protein